MTYKVFYIDILLANDKEILSYENDTESFVSDVLLEYQQCQMECNHSACSDSDDFEDTVPVADTRVSISKFGARGSIAVSSLLPSDAEQLLRVRSSMAQKTQYVFLPFVAIESVRNEADVVPQCMFQ